MNDTRKNIMVVDDQKSIRDFMCAILNENGYNHITAANGMEAIEQARQSLPDLIFLDALMPVLDGFETCRRLKNNPATWHIPIIMITGDFDRRTRIRALECGVNDFLQKPFDQAELMLKARNLLKIKEFDDFHMEYSAMLDAEVRKRTSDLYTANAELNESREMLKQGYIDTVHKLTMIAEHKDSDTATHIKRVGYLCAFLAEAIGWQTDEVEQIFYAAPMHDIGKVAIPSEILLKPGRLSVEEFALMKTHTTAGAKVLEGSQSVILQMAERIAFAHHERWDGKGYPTGLKAEEIPIEGAIMNIVDQYDALRSQRPYKKELSHTQVFKIITEGDERTEPGHFNPRLFEAFKDNHLHFERIFAEHSKENKEN